MMERMEIIVRELIDYNMCRKDFIQNSMQYLVCFVKVGCYRCEYVNKGYEDVGCFRVDKKGQMVVC